MDFNEQQKENASDPNSVMVEGDSKTTPDKAVHHVKASPPIFVTEVGIQTDCHEIRLSKT
jgi:hypothetical protein